MNTYAKAHTIDTKQKHNTRLTTRILNQIIKTKKAPLNSRRIQATKNSAGGPGCFSCVFWLITKQGLETIGAQKTPKREIYQLQRERRKTIDNIKTKRPWYSESFKYRKKRPYKCQAKQADKAGKNIILKQTEQWNEQHLLEGWQSSKVGTHTTPSSLNNTITNGEGFHPHNWTSSRH